MNTCPGVRSSRPARLFSFGLLDGLRVRWRELRKHPIAVVAMVIIIIYVLAAVFAPQITSHDPERGSLRDRLHPPVWQDGGSWEYPLGTDGEGRDIYTRIVYGARVSLMVGILSVVVSVAVGLGLGAASGYYRGKFDSGVSRFADLLMAFPFLIFTEIFAPGPRERATVYSVLTIDVVLLGVFFLLLPRKKRS